MNLIDLLPPIYDGNTTMQGLQTILSDKINALADGVNEAIDERFVSTASKLLSRYEKIYGIQVDVSKSDTFRRERIKAKIRGIGTTTKQMIKDVAASYSGGEVEVIEHPETNNFVVKFIGVLGIPGNMADLTLTIKEIKPAHLAFTFEYSYKTWAEVSGNLWGDVSTKTWYQFATGE